MSVRSKLEEFFTTKPKNIDIEDDDPYSHVHKYFKKGGKTEEYAEKIEVG